MRCKNCNNSLRTDYQFCPACGAKVIRRRLSISGLIEDFKDRFLNIDNTLFRTIAHLSTKPDVVVMSYINGVRGRYLNPVSYVTLAVAFMGVIYLIQRQFFPELMDIDMMLQGSKTDNAAYDAKVRQGVEKMMEFMADNLHLITFATLPFLALISKLVFWKMKNLNYSEHFVLNTYAYSHAYVITVLMAGLSMWNIEVYVWVSMLSTIVMILYYAFLAKRLFALSLIDIIARTMWFFVILTIFYMIVVIIVLGLFMLSPEWREMFIPAKEVAVNGLAYYFLV
jgi:hypothetical protein